MMYTLYKYSIMIGFTIISVDVSLIGKVVYLGYKRSTVPRSYTDYKKNTIVCTISTDSRRGVGGPVVCPSDPWWGVV